MSWIPSEADHVAAQHIRLWLAEGLTAPEMVYAVMGKSMPAATLDDAHHVIAEAWTWLRYGRLVA